MFTDTFWIISIQFLSTFIVLFGVFLKSYLTKKGENLATKEDISSITTQIENVKHQFDIDLEKNRTLYQKNLNRDSLFLNERTVRLLEFYDSVINFRTQNLGFNPWNSLSDDWSKTFKEHHEDTFTAYNKINKNFGLCSVFLKHHPNLLKSGHDLLLETNRAFNIYKKEFIHVKVAFFQEVEKFKSDEDKESIVNTLEKSDSVSKLYYSNLDLKKFSKALDNFMNELAVFFGDV